MAENKHTAADLAQMQALPLSAKITMTKQRIRAWYEYFDGQVYVSFSGGKDSTVLKHIVDSMYDDVPAVFVNTGLEYPEIQRFVREVKEGKYDCFNADVEILRPEMRFDEVIKEYGYPVFSKEVSQSIDEGRKYMKMLTDRQTDRQTEIPYAYRIADFLGIDRREDKSNELYKALKMGNIPSPNIRACQLFGIQGNYSYSKMYDKSRYLYALDAPFKISNKCCNIMKKKPMHQYEKTSGRKAIIGTMASESRLRKSNWMKYGCNGFESKNPKSQPLSFWTDQDVLEYILKYQVPYASVYGDIYEEGQIAGQMFIDGCHCKLVTSGANRTGCMFCMFGVHLDKLGENGDKNRFQIMKQTHPKQYEYCMKSVEDGGLGIKQVLEFIGVPYE